MTPLVGCYREVVCLYSGGHTTSWLLYDVYSGILLFQLPELIYTLELLYFSISVLISCNGVYSGISTQIYLYMQ